MKNPTRWRDCLLISSVSRSVEHWLSGIDVDPRSCYDESVENGDFHAVDGVGPVEIQGLDL